MRHGQRLAKPLAQGQAAKKPWRDRAPRHRAAVEACPRILARSSLQQDRQGLFVGDLCAVLKLPQGATANGVRDHQEGIARQTQHARDIPRRHLEGLGAQHQRSLAELFEANAVVQTAR